MRGAPTGFWGKLDTDQDGAVTAWHPLAAHAADVAACCEALLRQTLLGARLAAVAGLGELEPVQVERLSALAALHDIGKFSIGFQNKALRPPPFTCGHVAEVLALFGDAPYPERDRLCEALPFEDLVAWGGGGEAAFGLLVAAISHHGRPERVGGRHQQSWWRRRGGLDPFEGIAELVGRVRAWFPLAFTPEGPSLPEGAPSQHLFSGLVMLADWLGSDQRIFPFAVDEGDRMSFARAAAARALREIGLDAAGARATLGAAPPPFETLFGFPPRNAQAQVAALPCAAPGSVTILESETGSGKTEAALYRFLRLFAAGLVDGLTFALPTRTAATQIHTRVVQAIAHAFADPTTRPPVILAVPGYLAVDEVEGRRLAGFEVLWNDDDQERLRYRGWAAEHPKRYLAGPVVVATVDQVLLSALEVSHAHMRAASLSRQLLVVDEVHASDAYMIRLLEEVLRRHLGAGGQAFLMSATLGSTARCVLERPGSREAPSLDEAVAEAYPVVRHSGGGVACVIPVTRGPDREVTVERVGLMDDSVGVAALAVAAAAQGARVIVLRNTVRGCLDTQRAVEEQAAGQ